MFPDFSTVTEDFWVGNCTFVPLWYFFSSVAKMSIEDWGSGTLVAFFFLSYRCNVRSGHFPSYPSLPSLDFDVKTGVGSVLPIWEYVTNGWGLRR